ncbi:MAG: DUF3788 family protein [Lachnospiraceae bacterium]
MVQQLLRDATIKPTAEIIADGLGVTNAIYTKFIEELRKYSISLMDWRYYNDGKAWLSKGEYKWTTARGTNKVKPIFWLSIWEESFRVSFNFSEKIRAELIALPISEATKKIICNTEPNGKTIKFLPIVFNITEGNQLNDIYVLVEFRKKHIVRNLDKVGVQAQFL